MRWLRHLATTRNAAVLIPDHVIGSFHYHNRSGHTLVVGSSQPVEELSKRYITLDVNATVEWG